MRKPLLGGFWLAAFLALASSFDISGEISNQVDDAIDQVNAAETKTINDLTNPNKARTPEDLLRIIKFPSSEALEISKAAEVFERALNALEAEIGKGDSYDIPETGASRMSNLSPDQLSLLADLSGCSEHRPEENCDDICFHQRFRTFDGTCNNLQHTLWGASLTPLNRLIGPDYDNGLNRPKGFDPSKSYNGFPLPSTRKVSTEIASAPSITDDDDFTHMLMQWGQFLDHDIDLVPQAPSDQPCNVNCAYDSPCFPIPIPEDDVRIDSTQHPCMALTRSSAVCGTGVTSVFGDTVSMREQINEITSYIDGSNVYGSTDEAANNLRDLGSAEGLMRVGEMTTSGKPLLPVDNGDTAACEIDPNKAHEPCFLAGDVRANEQLGLISMHTLWLREHNRVAKKLAEINPGCDSDTLFHESRKIVGAQLQHITYSHWLPKILGTEGMELLGEYDGYDPHVDASIVNEFATAAFRFGHSLIRPTMLRLDSSFQETSYGNLDLHEAFFAPFRIRQEGGIDPIIRGFQYTAAKKLLPDELLNDELTERLFKLAHTVALDLAALNTQRGRDHGLPSYTEYRDYCGLGKAETFSDLSNEIKDSDVLQKLEDVYGHPDNIDLFVGGLTEDVVAGAKVGPTFLCILVEQFKRLRDGDRFWYEKDGVFTDDQLNEIKKSTLARIICDNSDGITAVQPDVFRRVDSIMEMMPCTYILSMNLAPWTDCCEVPCCQNGGVLNGKECDCPIGFSGELCEIEHSCKMYVHNNKVTPFIGPDVTVTPAKPKKDKEVLTKDDPAFTMPQKCRFLIKAKFDGKGFVAMNFAPSEARNKHAFTLYFNTKGNGFVRWAARGSSGKTKIDPMELANGYVMTEDDTSVMVKGTAANGYEVTSLSDCEYRFQYFHNAGDNPTFVAYLNPGSFQTEGHCGSIQE